jgi:hypothetical protein
MVQICSIPISWFRKLWRGEGYNTDREGRLLLDVSGEHIANVRSQFTGIEQVIFTIHYLDEATVKYVNIHAFWISRITWLSLPLKKCWNVWNERWPSISMIHAIVNMFGCYTSCFSSIFRLKTLICSETMAVKMKYWANQWLKFSCSSDNAVK